MNILYEDGAILVCEKPPGVPTQSDKTTDYDMVNHLKNYVHELTGTQPYIGLIHRLDRPVGGVMVFGKTPEATKNMNQQISERKVMKHYLAVTTSDLSEECGKDKILLVDYIRKDSRNNLGIVTTKADRLAKKAELYYRVLEVKKESSLSLVEVELITGRHHQIRVQMSSRGHGLWGDTKYNTHYNTSNYQEKYSQYMETDNPEWVHIALFAYKLEFIHPVLKKKMKFECLPNKKIYNQFNIIQEKAR